VVSFTSRPLYPGGLKPRYPLYSVGPRAGIGAVAKRKIPSPHQESKPYHPDRPTRSLVTIPTELSWLFQKSILILSSYICLSLAIDVSVQVFKPKFCRHAIAMINTKMKINMVCKITQTNLVQFKHDSVS
jgi:hypothetical protein